MTPRGDHHAAEKATQSDDLATYREMVSGLVERCRRCIAEQNVPVDTEPLLGWKPRHD